MRAVPRIPTRRNLPCRIWRAMERSWWPTLAIFIVVAVIAANFPG